MPAGPTGLAGGPGWSRLRPGIVSGGVIFVQHYPWNALFFPGRAVRMVVV